MDNLTHSLAGAVLGQLGLKKKTGLGMATLIIAANIPDIDAVATLLGGVQHLAIRRGITHGPLAMLILPIILAGIMIWFDNWQSRRGQKKWGRSPTRLPVHKGWLLTLAYIGCLSHPALDWLNSYGIRLLEPFSSRWFYGDSIFIIDIWIWAALIAGVWISRRREKMKQADWQRPAWISFATVSAYIFTNGLITGKAEADTAIAVEQGSGVTPVQVVANPVPITFWRRDVIWQMTGRNGKIYGEAQFDLMNSEKLNWQVPLVQSNASPELIEKSKAMNADVRDFLFWARLPVFLKEDRTGAGPGFVLNISDMRFQSPVAQSRFSVQANISLDKLSTTEAGSK
ncbi:metal-dependent hydrolase [Parasphingorhabdus sp. JC815]|uniref:metal-dependent hydrolase n=1 Tax=Parasphingorhabdus sp. JC815 TaxID=3232140 RepID=UPI0034574475